MSYSTTKANGNIKYYSEKQLQDLDYEGRFVELRPHFIHYGHNAKNIHVFSGETNYFFAKQPAGYVYLGSGDIEAETIGLPRLAMWKHQDVYIQIGKALYDIVKEGVSYNVAYDVSHDIAHKSSEQFIKQLTQYLIDYYDISQLVLHDEFESGRAQSDNEPSFDMSKYIKTIPATTLDPYSVPYHIQLPVHQKEFVITQDSIIINAFE